MVINEGDGFDIDYEFISKYIRDDSKENDNKDNKSVFSSQFDSNKKGPTEVFGSIGDDEMHSENISPFRKFSQKNSGYDDSDDSEESDDSNDSDDSPEKIVPGTGSKIIAEAKKEFKEHLEDESLTTDTCERLTHDWNK